MKIKKLAEKIAYIAVAVLMLKLGNDISWSWSISIVLSVYFAVLAARTE